MQTPFGMLYRNFILPEFCKPCLFLSSIQFAQFIVPYQPFTFAAAPVCKRSGRRRSCNLTRAKIPITQQKSVPNGHGLLLLVCGGDEGDRTPYLLNAIQALSQVSYTPTGLLPFGNRV